MRSKAASTAGGTLGFTDESVLVMGEEQAEWVRGTAGASEGAVEYGQAFFFEQPVELRRALLSALELAGY